MGLFSKIFGKKENANLPIEYADAIACNKEVDSLLSEDRFIARSDYKHILEKNKDIYTFFASTRKANTLSYYCKQNRLQETEIKKFLLHYEDIKDLEKGSVLFTEHNDNFVKNHLQSEKSYLDKILYEVDSKILLDEEQRKVILSDEDYTLIIAGAGAGKTTTVAAKVRYLVEKKHIDPKQILVISFTNKAVGELKERINTGLLIPYSLSNNNFS